MAAVVCKKFQETFIKILLLIDAFLSQDSWHWILIGT
jgi:hypothetical protein